jgi:DNA-binding transcriptional LysR family regulator
VKGSRIYIDIFKVFCDAAETKSFSRAAEINFITQSAVSQQISYLESYFGKQLIIRGKGKFALTQEGKVFLSGCENILQTYQSTLDKMQSEPGEIAQTINVEAIYSIGFYHLPPLVKSFMKKYKQLNLHLEYNRSDKIYTDVIQGVCDFGIVAYPWQHPLVEITFGPREKLICVFAPSFEFAKRKKLRVKDMDGKSYIGFIKKIPTRGAIDALFSGSKTKVNIIHEFDNVETLKRSLELGHGFSFLPENTVQQELRKKDLMTIPVAGEPLYRETGIITRKDRPLSKATKEAIQFLLK